MFLLGLVSFLIGHIFYVAAFIAVAGLNTLTFIGTLFTLGVSIGVYIWLKPHLGTMKVPVIFYIVVISVMLCGAWSILGESDLTEPGRLLVFTGALSFYHHRWPGRCKTFSP
ncbi:lysoplasmalogenase [Dehalococcoidia bacterium]|nr:lysoplasmalogenase [Dehalococcoidia bacterium]